mmetsp:Transcript_9973/g.11954  ORF Transcript_9973/g.11954 Transcript_9973/m.11954 type:complete len:206 (-) Transcript_9973:156-773(-)|eukprot:CAMPEP_0195268004 /NCGR_PEP_ID=MMETSP0706-20130129/12919_1 /TAXON_ID=33640 /ORGANISM="Asterionellopsis glacialis, Strain CCMP134" /LENGTH=205 /DNA_ID=CAMNT_0040322847 /DNA_START=142 /DNA_END=759 /DNA_ORIENTATION=-
MQATAEAPTTAPGAVHVPLSPNETVDAKIQADISTLVEKMDLCQSMIRPGDGSPTPSLKNNETLLAVVGFLEACAPRMVELVEAGSQGALSEEVLIQCLEVNDRLQKQLADIETVSLTESAATTTAASVSSPAAASSYEVTAATDQLDDLLLDSSATDNVVPTKSDDPFGDTTLTPTAPPAGKTTGEETEGADDFDAFLADRTSK